MWAVVTYSVTIKAVRERTLITVEGQAQFSVPL
jgi:hypothetical protein